MATKNNSKGMYIVIGMIILLLAGFVFYFMSSKKSPTGLVGSNKSEGIFTSIKDALSKSVSLQCTFTDESGRKTTSYIKNGAIRADIVSSIADESGSVILKDNKTYFWNNKGGFVMTVEPDKTKTNGNNPAQSQGDSIMKELEKYKDSCKASVVSDSLFTPPSDVKFTDLSKLMKGNGSVPGVDLKQYQNIPQDSSPDTAQ